MRLVQMIHTNSIDLSNVQTIVLDEADRLFDMGFIEQVFCNSSRNWMRVKYLMNNRLIKTHNYDNTHYLSNVAGWQVDEILAACTHPHKRVSMFSATMFQGVEVLSSLHSSLLIQYFELLFVSYQGCLGMTRFSLD